MTKALPRRQRRLRRKAKGNEDLNIFLFARRKLFYFLFFSALLIVTLASRCHVLYGMAWQQVGKKKLRENLKSSSFSFLALEMMEEFLIQDSNWFLILLTRLLILQKKRTRLWVWRADRIWICKKYCSKRIEILNKASFLVMVTFNEIYNDENFKRIFRIFQIASFSFVLFCSFIVQ